MVVGLLVMCLKKLFWFGISIKVTPNDKEDMIVILLVITLTVASFILIMGQQKSVWGTCN